MRVIQLVSARRTRLNVLVLLTLAFAGESPTCCIQIHDGMQACVRLDDGECSDKFDEGQGECSDKFDEGQGLRQGCVLAPLLFNIFFTAVLCGREALPL